MYDRGLIDAEVHMEYYANKTGIEIEGLTKRINYEEPIDHHPKDGEHPKSALEWNEEYETEKDEEEPTTKTGDPLFVEKPTQEPRKAELPTVESSRPSPPDLNSLLTFDTIRDIIKW